MADYSEGLVTDLARSADITVIAHRDASEPTMEEHGGFRILRVWEPWRVSSPFQLSAQIRRLRPDVVHIQYGLYGADYGGLVGEPILILAFLLRMARIPVVVTLHSLWPRHEVRQRALERELSPLAARLAESAVSVIMKLFAITPNRLLLSVTSSDSPATGLFAREYSIPPERVAPAVYGVRKVAVEDREKARLQLGLALETPVFLVFGFIYEDKGIDIAVEALSLLAGRLDNAVLLIAGPPLPGRGDAYIEKLREAAKKVPSSMSVRIWPDYVDEERASALFAAADAILIPYRRTVGTSSVLNRALSAGRATISTPLGWHRLRGAGIIEVPHADPAQFAEAMISVACNPALRSRLEEEARLAADARRWDKVAQDTLAVYREVCGGGRGERVAPRG